MLTKFTHQFVAGLTAMIHLGASASLACTTFSFVQDRGTFVAKSYDWGQEQGYVHVNKRGVSKRAMEVFPTDQPMEWQSRYGSVTFNQYGRELPNAGINEAGLIVEVMELQGSSFPREATSPSLNESQWVQYMLDTASSVDEVNDLAGKARVSKILVPLHYMVCDKTGACITIEYVDQELKITSTAASGVNVLTNNTYADSLAVLKGYQGFGGSAEIPRGSSSLSRFVRTAAYLQTQSSEAITDPFNFAFAGLKSVFNGITRWQIVYNGASREIQFSTTTAPQLKQIDTKTFDFDCSKPVRTFNMNSNSQGPINDLFEDYSQGANEALVRKSLGTSVPAHIIKMAVALPATTKCVMTSF